MSLDPFIRIPSLHMGASESLQNPLSHYLDPMFSLLVSSWKCSKISISLSIGWITSCFVALDSFSRLMSLTCLLPKASISISCLGTSFHFAITCLMLWDMFVDHDHIFALYTYHGPNIPFFIWCSILFSSRCSYLHYRNVKDIFTHSSSFEKVTLITLSFFFMKLGLETKSRVYGYRWSIDLMMTLFFMPFSFYGLLIEIL